MDNIRVEQKTSEWSKSHRRKRAWQKVLLGMMAVVVFTTTYALILPAITKEQETFCGHEEHVHSEACFVSEQGLVCALAEGAVHTHGESCYTEQPVLLCGLTEQEAHTHTDACYEEQTVYTCGLEESEGHKHTDACYARELTCEDTNPAHVHTNVCYEVKRELICEETDPAHEHGDDCYAPVLLCELEESEGHVHSDACRKTEQVLVCALQEGEGHAHSEDCWGTEQVLTCTLPETEEPHVHTEACYMSILLLACDKQEHTHTLQCFSDPSADLETEAVWAKSVANVELTGDWRQDVLAIAETQLGQGESEKNYRVDPQGNKQGYTRYGAWWSDENAYDPWCGMFVSFCLNYAGVDRAVVPFDSGTVHWVETLTQAGLWRCKCNYDPKPGDLVFFDLNGDEQADHVGLVYTFGEGELTTVEGNNSATVETFSYSADDSRILYYAELPENPNPDVAITPASRGWAEQGRAEVKSVMLTAALDDGTLVTLTGPAAYLPWPVEELTLSVTRVEDAAAEALVEGETAEPAPEDGEEPAPEDEPASDDILLFDIKLLHNGEEVQPLGEVVVTFTGLDAAYAGAQVYHVDPEAQTVEEVTAPAGGGGPAMKVKHFSYYAIAKAARGTGNLKAVNPNQDLYFAIDMLVCGGSRMVNGKFVPAYHDWTRDQEFAWESYPAHAWDKDVDLVFRFPNIPAYAQPGNPMIPVSFSVVDIVPYSEPTGYYGYSIDRAWHVIKVPASEIQRVRAVYPNFPEGFVVDAGIEFLYYRNGLQYQADGVSACPSQYIYGRAMFTGLVDALPDISTAVAGYGPGYSLGKHSIGDMFSKQYYQTYYNSPITGRSWTDDGGRYTIPGGQTGRWEVGCPPQPAPTPTPPPSPTPMQPPTPQPTGYTDLRILKTDPQGKPITNAGFHITGTSSLTGESFNVEATHDGEGWYRFSNLPIGLNTDWYVIEETTVPPGYKKMWNIGASGDLGYGGPYQGPGETHDFDYYQPHNSAYLYDLINNGGDQNTLYGTANGWTGDPNHPGAAGYWDPNTGWWQRPGQTLAIIDWPIGSDGGGGGTPPSPWYPWIPTPTPPPTPTSDDLIRIYKTDDAGHGLAGCVFGLYSGPYYSGPNGDYRVYAGAFVDHGNGWYTYELTEADYALNTNGGGWHIREDFAPIGYDRLHPTVYRMPAAPPGLQNIREDGSWFIGYYTYYDYLRGARMGNRTNYWLVEDGKLENSSLLLEKRDEGGHLLTGAEFEIGGYDIWRRPFHRRSYEVDPVAQPGVYRIDDVPPGLDTDIYTLREITPPAGYAAVPDIKISGKEFYDHSGGVYALPNPVIDKLRTGVMQFRKIDGMTGDPLSGAVFEMTYDASSSPYNATLAAAFPITAVEVTDSSGNGTGLYEFTGVPEGLDTDLYTITETQTPDDTKYRPVAPFTVKGSLFSPAKGTYYHQTTLVDEVYGGTLRFTKVAEGTSTALLGAKFTMTGHSSLYGDFTLTSVDLYQESVQAGTPDASLMGVYEFRNIPKDGATPYNTYTVHEETPPAGYGRAPDFTVTWGDFTELTPGADDWFCDYDALSGGPVEDPYLAKLRFQKVAEGTNPPEPLTGAEFLMEGRNRVHGDFYLYSVDLYQESVDAGTPDDALKGWYEFRDVRIGTASDVYTVREIKAPPGYGYAKSFAVTGEKFIDGDYVYPSDIEDPPAVADLVFTKVSGVTGQRLSGLSFTMTYNAAKSSPIDPALQAKFPLTSLEEDPVNNPGVYVIRGVPQGLATDVYTVTEDAATLPHGYRPVQFDVTGDKFDPAVGSYTYRDPGSPAGYVIDPPIGGTLTIEKVIKGTTTPLTGAEFTMTGTSSVFGPFAIRSVDLYQESVDAGTPDDALKGLYEIRGVPIDEASPLNDYTIRETRPPAGYAAAPDFTVTWGDFSESSPGAGDWSCVYKTLPRGGLIEDESKANVLQFRKEGGVNGLPLSGASFVLEVYDAATDTWLGFSPAVTSQEVTGSPGLYEFENVPPGNATDRYRVRETNAPAGYALCDPFEIPGDACSAGTYTYVDPNTYSGAVADPPITGTLRFTKVSSADPNTKLTGAVFEMTGKSSIHGNFILYSVDLYEEAVTNGETDTSVLDGLKGKYEIRGVPIDAGNNDYKVEEVIVPAGYAACTPFTVKWSDFTETPAGSGNYFCDYDNDVNSGNPVEDTPNAWKLTVTKAVQNGASGAQFVFSVAVKDSNGDPLTPPTSAITVIDAANNPVSGGAYVLGQQVFAFLQAGWRLEIANIPAGCTATVTETYHTGYDVWIDGALSATASTDVTMDGHKTVNFENRRQYTKVKIAKDVLDDKTGLFDFVVQLPAADAAGVTATLYDAGDVAITGRDVDFVTDPRTNERTGEIRFKLADNEYVLLEGVPVGTQMQLTETRHNDYGVVIKDVTNGPETTGDTATIGINNPTLNEIVVKNNPGYKLPHTGGLGTFLNTLFGATIMAATVAIGLKRRRRERRFNT